MKLQMVRVAKNCFAASLLVWVLPALAIPPQQPADQTGSSALVEILQAKGILTPDDVARIHAANSAQDANRRLADILLAKGVINQAEHDRLTGPPMPPAPLAVAPPPRQTPPPSPAAPPESSGAAGTLAAQAPPNPTEPGAPSLVEKTPQRKIDEALVPIRSLPIGGVKHGDTPPAFKAEGVGMTPYGFLKATAVEDSSSPQGDDFPLPGFIAANTGPNGDPEFHIKARSSRFGANFEWLDANRKWVITGKLEADFEGNFNRSDNRNLSTIRSSNPSIRLAWGRLDYRFNDNNVISALFGQDWTVFSCSTLPNMLETTGVGIGFGALWERDPQMRVGFTHRAGKVSIMPEFALDLPVSGLPPSAANISNQLGYGERQGPDSNRPELQGRMAIQWQLDHAAGVAPAQLIASGFQGHRTAVVLASAIPAAYSAAYPNGVSAGSTQDGWTAEWQLPTRWFTLIGKYYSGSDLRWFFGGQLYSFYNDTAGLTATATVPSVDGASNIVIGLNSAGQAIVAPQRPVRADGGFAQIGFPLSRIFGANPSGRNAGWSLYLLYGVDQAKTRDLDKVLGARRYSTMGVGTLNYKLNRWVSFSFEQSLYTTHANPELPLPLFKGFHSREWNDVREEAGPIFYF